MPLRVEQANETQMRRITELSAGFAKESEFVKVDFEHSIKNYLNFTKLGMGGMLALLDGETVLGGLGYVIAPDLHFPRTMAIETFWYVPPESRGGGIKLLNAFEALAKEKHCDSIAMIHMSDSQPEALEKLYIRKGFRLMEKHYTKEVTP